MLDDDHGSIEQGIIGGADEDYFEIGEGDGQNLPLFTVTLTRGRNHADPLEEKPQGLELLCRWGMIIDWIPPKGTKCIVAIPAGMRGIPGAGVIIGVVRENGAQFKPDRAMLNLGPDTHVLLKGKSASLSDYSEPARYVTVGISRGGGPAGVIVQDETGSGMTVQAGVVAVFSASGGDAKSLVQLTPTSFEAMSKGNGMIRLKSEQLSMLSTKETFLSAARILAGGGTTGFVPVCVNVAGVPTPSTSFFAAPV